MDGQTRCADCLDPAVDWGHNRMLCDECLWEEEMEAE